MAVFKFLGCQRTPSKYATGELPLMQNASNPCRPLA